VINHLAPDAAVRALLVPLAAHGLAGSMFEMPSEPFSPDQWFALVRTCEAQGLIGMLAAAAQRESITLSPAQAEELAVRENEAAGLALLIEQRVVRLSALLAAGGVTHRLVGAPARARLGYRQPGIRTFDSATLLVESTELGATVPRGVTVAQAVRLTDGRSIDVAQLSHPPTLLALADHPVPTASLEEHLVLACLDMVAARSRDLADPAGAFDLVSQRDVAELALSRALDPAGVQHTAESWGVAKQVASAVADVWELFGLADKTRLSVWAYRMAASTDTPARGTTTNPPRTTQARRRPSGVVGRMVHKVHKLAPGVVGSRTARRVR
jgi:hypothetical protein